MTPWFGAWGRLVVRHRWAVLLVVGAISALAITTIATRLRIDNSVESFASSKDADVQNLLESFRDEFGRDDAFLVLIEGDVFSLEYLQKLRAAHKEIEALNLDIPTLGERKAELARLVGEHLDELCDRIATGDPDDPGPCLPAFVLRELRQITTCGDFTRG